MPTVATLLCGLFYIGSWVGTVNKSLDAQSKQIVALTQQNSKMSEQIDRIEFRLRIPQDVTPEFYVTPPTAQSSKSAKEKSTAPSETSQIGPKSDIARTSW